MASRRGASGFAAAVLLTALACASADILTDPLPLSDWSNGTSVFWGGPQDGQDDPFNMRLAPGACGYGEMDSKMWPFYLVTGISPDSPLVQRRPQASCGTCLEVKCASTDPKVCASSESITVVVVDECPNCKPNELNLHAFAFEQIANLDHGSAAIQYRQVECSPVDNITVRVDSFRVVQGGWLRLSFKSVASDGGIVRVELASSTNGGNTSSTTGRGNISNSTVDRVWKSMDNTYGAEWELSALPAPPYDVRLTDRYGRKVVLSAAITKPGAIGEFPGRAQFPGLDAHTIAAHPEGVDDQARPNVAAVAPAKATPAPKAAATPQPAVTKPKPTPAATMPGKPSPAANTTAKPTPAPASTVKSSVTRVAHRRALRQERR